VTTIWRDGQKLFIDAPIPGSLGAVALHPTSETEFYPTHGSSKDDRELRRLKRSPHSVEHPTYQLQ
jgi:hypothetical protein